MEVHYFVIINAQKKNERSEVKVLFIILPSFCLKHLLLALFRLPHY